MKRNFWKISTALIGALSLGISHPALADGTSSLTGSGTTPDIITVTITSPSAELTYGSRKLTGNFNLDYATNVVGKKMQFSFGQAITAPTDTVAAPTYKLTMALSGGTGDGKITYTPTWTTLAYNGVPTAKASPQLEEGVSVTGATVNITLERDDSSTKEMIAGAYALPATLTIVNGS